MLFRSTLRIFSFSYHQGLPADDSGNGGGFVFDCRGLPNPGREERFRDLTGKDLAVKEFLEQQESVHRFFESAVNLVKPSVDLYQRRGFKRLMASFGCTGGQHRSVYLVNRISEHFRAKKDLIDLQLNFLNRHRELDSIPVAKS